MMKEKNKCKKCGDCCRNGPPTLHKEDAYLYKEGHIKRSHLITYRKGEVIYDNVKDALISLDQEIVKLKSKKGKKECIFLENNLCSIYPFRPKECRVFNCWNIRDFLEFYSKDRAQRLDLVSNPSALAEIIIEHEKRCSVTELNFYINEFKKTKDKDFLKKIHILLDQDRFFRDYLIEAGADKEEFDFIFGKELTNFVPPEIMSLIDLKS